MLEKIIDKTNEYIERMSKKERKKYGQFFTSSETATYMANLFDIPLESSTLRLLDPGAGTGILICALIERLNTINQINRIEITCYENDENVLSLLEENLDYIKTNSTIELTYEIIDKNYITSQETDYNNMIGANADPIKYDMVIGNPPYMKLPKDAPEAKAMPNICYGSPNSYFLFIAMSLFNLKDNAEMVYIVPRSWTSGAYFKQFREYLLTNGILSNVHLFVSRKDVFDKEDVLQETIIIKVKKTHKKIDTASITTTQSNKDFKNITTFKIPYDGLIDNNYVYLPANENELKVVEYVHRWNKTLPDLGFKMKTGLTVDFRNRELLASEDSDDRVPLFFSQHIKNGVVSFPIGKDNEYIETSYKGLIQKNKNYLFVKRFTSKEEHKRLQCGIYLNKNLPKYDVISTQNKINFIDGVSVKMSECIVYGLYVIFNSTLYDTYYRILNGSTQVNSTEINSIPVPDIDIIENMGRKLMKLNDLSEVVCNNILEEFYGKN